VHARRDFQRYLELAALGKLDLEGLITDRIALEDASSALTSLNTRQDIARQVIIID
jgi:threonine dehydrogenase-like Zn-dependent dehydrogenase